MHEPFQQQQPRQNITKAVLPIKVALLVTMVSVVAAIVGTSYAHAHPNNGSKRPSASHAQVISLSSSAWVGTWGASPIQPLGPKDTLGLPTAFVNQTVRNVVNPHLAGTAVRIRLSNKFGTRPVIFTSVYIGNGAGGAAIVPGTNTQLTFGGSPSVTLQPGQRMYSDSVPLNVQPFHDLVISFYLPTLTGPATQHTNAQQTNYVAVGNQASNTTGLTFATDGEAWYFLTDVNVNANANSASIVEFGDSITDGLESTIDANHRYPDFLAQRLQASSIYSCLSSINEGIAGNRVLYANIGPSGLNRLNSDVLTQPNVKYMILLNGVNDLADPFFLDPTMTQQVSAQQLIDGLTKIANEAHAKGIKVFAATILPTGDAASPARPPFTTYSTPQVENKRHIVNHFIRNNGGVFDGVFDFSRAIANPADQDELNPIYANVDNFHPNDAGYQLLAQTVNLADFSPC